MHLMRLQAIMLLASAVILSASAPASADDEMCTFDECKILIPAFTAQECGEMYELMENTLIERLVADTNQNVRIQSGVIAALGRMRSTKAVPHLLDRLEFSPSRVVFPDGSSMLVNPGTYDNAYPCILALKNIGALSMEQILAFINKAEKHSQREVLLTKLGWFCFGSEFIRVVEDRTTDASVDGKETKWVQVRSYLPSAARVEGQTDAPQDSTIKK